MTARPALVVIAKEPVPGRVKTRLCPPCDATEAAALAAAALADTLAAVASTPVLRRVLALDGDAGTWVPPEFEVIPQARGGLDARLAAAIAAVGEPALVVGMDTPQVTPELLAGALDRLADPEVDAVLGPAGDGGYWALGLSVPDPEAVAGVPMSVPWTARAQRVRLRELSLRVAELPELRDVDDFSDAQAVACRYPRTRFAARLRALEGGWAVATGAAGRA